MSLLAALLLFHSVPARATALPEKIPEVLAKPAPGSLALVPMSNPAWLTDLRTALQALPMRTPVAQQQPGAENPAAAAATQAAVPEAKAALEEIAREVPPAAVEEDPAQAGETLDKAYSNAGTQEDSDAPLVLPSLPGFDQTVSAMLAKANESRRTVVVNFAGVRLKAEPDDSFKDVERPWIDHLVLRRTIGMIRARREALKSPGAPPILAGSAPPAPKAPWRVRDPQPPRTSPQFIPNLRDLARAQKVSLEHYALTSLLDKHEIRQFVYYYIHEDPFFAGNEVRSYVTKHKVQPGTGEHWLAALEEFGN